MNPSIRLGKWFGIEVGFNWSLVFIFALIAWSLATGVLPVEAPGSSQLSYWLAGVLGAVLFYFGLLAHELAHAVVARSRGVEVKGITLWLFGGVSQLEGEPDTAGSEALITAVGPITSLVVAAAFFGLAEAAGVAGAGRLPISLLAWLAVLNIALALFNLLPAFPLDGGRLLAALLWKRRGSRRQGVHDAIRVGRVVAILMIAGGAVELFLGSALNGIWIAFLGWFLLSAAGAEEASMTVHALLRSVPVSAVMSSPVVTVPDWLTLDSFLVSAAPGLHFTTYPLTDQGGRLTGVARLGDILRVPARERAERRLRDVAHPIADMPVCAPDDALETVLRQIGPALQRRVLVYAGSLLVGIVSPADVMRTITLKQSTAGGANAAA